MNEFKAAITKAMRIIEDCAAIIDHDENVKECFLEAYGTEYEDYKMVWLVMAHLEECFKN